MQSDVSASKKGGQRTRTAQSSWWVLVVVAGAQFMVVLDVSVVNVALPSIRDALDVPPDRLPWIANAYALVFGGLLLLGGRLGDLRDRRGVFLTGLAVFTGASLVGGLSWNLESLVGARSLQGAGAALVTPSTLAILTLTFPPGPRRTRALAVWGAVGSLGGAAGGLVGGTLTDLWSWRAILLVNVVVGAVLLPVGLRSLSPSARTDRRRPLDARAGLLAATTLAATTHGIGQLGDRSAGLWRGSAWLATGLLGAIGLIVLELRARAEPLFPLRLLRRRSVSVGAAVTLLSGACLQIPVWYFLTFFMQDALGLTPLQTGLGFLPHTVVGLGLGLSLTPWLMRRVESRNLVVVGALVTAAGFWWQASVSVGDGYIGAVLAPATALSLGSALFVTPLTSVVVDEVSDQDAGAVSGLMSTAKQVGGVLGLATLALVADAGAGPADVLAATGRTFAVMTGALLAVAALALLLPRDPPAAPPDLTSRPPPHTPRSAQRGMARPHAVRSAGRGEALRPASSGAGHLHLTGSHRRGPRVAVWA